MCWVSKMSKQVKGYIMEQVQLMIKKVQALNPTKHKKMDQDKDCCPPFLPIGSSKGQFGGMLRTNWRPFRYPSNPRDISSRNQARRSLKVWFESYLDQTKGGNPHYSIILAIGKVNILIQAMLCKQSEIFYFLRTQVNFSRNVKPFFHGTLYLLPTKSGWPHRRFFLLWFVFSHQPATHDNHHCRRCIVPFDLRSLSQWYVPVKPQETNKSKEYYKMQKMVGTLYERVGKSQTWALPLHYFHRAGS